VRSISALPEEEEEEEEKEEGEGEEEVEEEEEVEGKGVEQKSNFLHARHPHTCEKHEDIAFAFSLVNAHDHINARIHGGACLHVALGVIYVHLVGTTCISRRREERAEGGTSWDTE
jgi:hypothetical protein